MYHHFWLQRGGALGTPLHCVQEVPEIQPEAQAFKVLIFPVRNHLPGSPCLMMRHPAEPQQCASCGGISNARDLHTGLCILQISGALLEVYQGFHQHSATLV